MCVLLKSFYIANDEPISPKTHNLHIKRKDKLKEIVSSSILNVFLLFYIIKA